MNDLNLFDKITYWYHAILTAIIVFAGTFIPLLGQPTTTISSKIVIYILFNLFFGIIMVGPICGLVISLAVRGGGACIIPWYLITKVGEYFGDPVIEWPYLEWLFLYSIVCMFNIYTAIRLKTKGKDVYGFGFID